MTLPRRALLAAGAALVASSGLAAQRQPPPEASDAMPGAKQQGEGRLTFLGLHVYDARLWVPTEGFVPAEWQRSLLVLELQYARKLLGRSIAERSLAEMRRQADIGKADAERWLAAMVDAFANVERGDRLSALHTVDGSTARFFFNGTLRGDVSDARFARLFFGIWLAPETSQPALRKQLLGSTT